MIKKNDTLPWYNSDYRLPEQVKTLLSQEEVQMLHTLARDDFQGAGVIVDAGPFLGGSTVALLDGLAENPQFNPKTHRIHSYDLFQTAGNLFTWGDLGSEFGPGHSFRAEFEANLGGKRDVVEVHEGDILQQKWEGGPIEILFVDIAKNAGILQHIASEFYPHLIPGRSVLIHQDLQYPLCPWIHISMHMLREYFSVIDYLPCNSAVFRLERAIPAEAIAATFYDNLSAEQKMKLHQEAIGLLPQSGRLMLELDEVEWLRDGGREEEATLRLIEIQRQSYGDLRAYAQVVGAASRLFPQFYCPEAAIDFPPGLADPRLELASQMSATERLILFTLIAGLRPLRTLEVGRARGGSTYVIAEALKRQPQSHFVSMDPNNWPEHRISQPLRASLSPRVHFLDAYCPWQVPKAAEIAGGNFDFVFLDGDHSYEAVKRDLVGLIPFLVPGGHILMHDAHFHPLDNAVREVVAQTGILDCGNLVSEFYGELAHIIIDGKPSLYGGMRLLRKPTSDTASQMAEDLSPADQTARFLQKENKRLQKELERQRSKRFWPKLKKSLRKRFGTS